MVVARDPVFTHYPDRGCAVYPVCLECPFPRCIEEMPHGMQNVRLLQRAAEVDKQRKQGKSIKDISLRLKVSERTVRRSLDLLKK